MSEIWNSNLWQFIAVIIAIVAIVVSVILYFKPHSRKALSYSIIARTALLKVDRTIKDDLQMLYKGKPVEQVYLILIKIINSGSSPIRKEDFEQPINIRFNKEASILSAEIANADPKELEASASFNIQNMTLDPCLMNKGDAITLRFIVNKLQGDISVHGRIVGVKEIKKIVENRYESLINFAEGAVSAAVLSVIIGFYMVKFFTFSLIFQREGLIG